VWHRGVRVEENKDRKVGKAYCHMATRFSSMVDVVDSVTRSRMMAGIRGQNTKPEILIRRLLHGQGFRFRLHVRELPGKPDIVLPRFRAAIFVHGCFWHGHDCPLFKWPATRPDFWREKIWRNRTNDQKARDALLAKGWRVGVVWECAVRGASKDVDGVGRRLAGWLHSDSPFFEERGEATDVCAPGVTLGAV
jgi:DNA mismatch endonuclease (patch repair protein)